MFIQFSTDRYVKKYQVYQIADRFTIACAVIPLFFCVRGTLAQDNSRLTEEHLATTHLQEHMVGWQKRPAAALVERALWQVRVAWWRKWQQATTKWKFVPRQANATSSWLPHNLELPCSSRQRTSRLFLVLLPVQWLLGCILQPPLCLMTQARVARCES